ncbi:MAG: hypothetical protein ACREM8_14755, partial [Vulcanimicrobiaceae bacterium]
RELERAATLLSRNWTIALPTAIASLVVLFLVVIPIVAAVIGSIVSVGLLHAAGLPFVGLGALTVIGGICAAIVVTLVAHAAVIHAADDAWLERPINLPAAVGVGIARLPSMVIASIAGFLLLLIPILLSFVVIGIPLVLIAAYLLIFTLPAIVIDGRGGIDAIGVSIRMSMRHVGPSVVAAIGMWLAIGIGQVVAGTIGHIPLLGWAAAFLIGGLTQAYAALVAARFYVLLRAN